MEKKFDLIPHIKDLYDKGENIIRFLKDIDSRESNTLEDILISYDFQAGSYIKIVKENPQYIKKYVTAIADILRDLGEFNSLLEVGVGEATTLGNLSLELNKPDLALLGFDISWSRIHYGTKYLKEINQQANLFVADLFHIPLADSSVDVVYTSHSIEPNGGREKEALSELYRVAKKYVVLLEPTSEFADSQGKDRMKANGYVHNLKNTINDLGYCLIEYKAFPIISNPLNPTGLYIIKKTDDNIAAKNNMPHFTCPISKEIMQEYEDHFFSASAYISYPKIMGIPCLSIFNGILTSKHD